MRGTTSGALPKLPPAVRRLGRKGKLYGQIPAGPDEYRVTVDEEIRILRRRHRKAERDERMDITRALTPVKDYMGGFTRPTDLRASNWFPGGAYKMDARGYESPFPAAYEPHTVFLLESRYPVIHGVGRDDSYEHVVGICREGDLPAVLRMYNSRSCPHEDLEVMDRARWPWMKPKKIKTINWWGKGETRESAMALIAQELEQEVAQAEVQAAEKAKLNPNPTRRPTLGRSASSSKPRPVPPEVLNKSSTSKGSASHARTFHSSVLVRVPDDKSSGTHPRNAIPTSSWSRPPRASQPESDNVVPAYYVERKRQRDTLTERKEEEGSLMAELNAGILSEGHAADIKPRAEKIPVEIAHEDGTIRHPSGFEPPTPETDFHPVASKPASAPKAPWTELLGGNKPRAFHSSALVRAEEVPPHQYPPHFFNRDADAAETAAAEDGIAVDNEVDTSVKKPPPQSQYKPTSEERAELRAQYLPLLGTEPFWRPLLTATFTTRPLACTIARLARGMSRGMPFYASIPDKERWGASFSTRIRNLRLNRIQSLTCEIARLLRGERGGIVGLRFSVEERGRAIHGEGLQMPVPVEKRIIKVGVGEWYPWAKEVQERFREDGKEHEYDNALEVFGVDEFGKRMDGVEWRQERPLTNSRSIEADALATIPQEDREAMSDFEKKQVVYKYMMDHMGELANMGSDRHSAVVYPNISSQYSD